MLPPEETALAPPLGKVRRQLQKLQQKFSALVDWARIAGEWGGWNATFFVSGKLRGGSDTPRHKTDELLLFALGENTALVAFKSVARLTRWSQQQKNAKSNNPCAHRRPITWHYLPPSPSFPEPWTHHLWWRDAWRKTENNVCGRHGAYLRVLTGQSRAAGSSMRRGEAASLRSVLHHAHNQGRGKKEGKKRPVQAPPIKT